MVLIILNKNIFLFSTEESTGVLKKAESEYKGHRSLLTRTRNLLSTMKRQDVIDRLNKINLISFPFQDSSLKIMFLRLNIMFAGL